MPNWREFQINRLWPVVRPMRWWLAGWLIVAFVAVPWALRNEERDLEAAGRTALADAGIEVDNLAFTGRHAVVVAEMDATERLRAEEALSEVSGIRGVEWQVTAPPPPPAPPPTTLPPGSTPSDLRARVARGELTVGGTLPDARSIAAITAAADLLYGPGVVNALVVDTMASTETWLRAAPQAITSLTMLGRATLVLDADGAALSGVAPDQASAEAAVAALQVALGADVPLDVSVTVADGPLPEVVIAAVDGEVRVGGFVPRRRVLEDILEAVESAAGPSPVVNEMVVDKSRVDTYLLHRISGLVERLAIGGQWSLRYDGVELAGAVAGRSVFKAGDSRIGAKLEGVLDGIGALMIADTRPGLVVEVASDTADSKAGNDDLSRDRLVATVIRLVRLGIEPDRIQTGVASGSGELLRFRLSSADR